MSAEEKLDLVLSRLDEISANYRGATQVYQATWGDVLAAIVGSIAGGLVVIAALWWLA